MLQRCLATIVTGLALMLTVSGSALADERPGAGVSRDAPALCARLEATAHALRAEIARIEAVQQRIEQKLAGGDLRPRQEARAKRALRLLEGRQGELEQALARVLEAYARHCS